MNETTDFGLWQIVFINSLVFLFLTFSFFQPKTKWDWQTGFPIIQTTFFKLCWDGKEILIWVHCILPVISWSLSDSFCLPLPGKFYIELNETSKLPVPVRIRGSGIRNTQRSS